MHIRLKPLAALLLPLFAVNTQTLAQQSLDPVVVTATRTESRVSEVLADVTVIDREEIERSAGGSVVDLLSRQPGIQIYTSGPSGPGFVSGIFVRGANPDQTKVLVDGIPIGDAGSQSGTKALANLSLANVERIEILRGPASTLYGADAIGGVIQVFTRKGTPGLKFDGFAGFGSYGTTQINAGVSGGDERWRFRIEGSRDDSDGFSAQKNASNRDADKDGYRNSAGSVALAFVPVKGHELGLTYRQNNGRSHYDSDSPNNNALNAFLPATTFAAGLLDNHIDFHTEQWQIYSNNKFTDAWTSKLQYGETWEKQSNYYGDGYTTNWGTGVMTPGAPLSRDESRTKNKLLGWQNDINLQSWGKAVLGLERTEQEGRYLSMGASIYPSTRVTNDAVFAAWNGKWDKHRWQLSARHDDHSKFGSKTTGAIAYGYQFAPEWRAHASYGTAFKAPSVSQLYYPPMWGGNPLLKPEEAKNGELGLNWETTTQSASVTYYRNRVKNMIVSDPATWLYDNIAKARLEGVTLAYHGRFGDWALRGTYDWLDATDDSTGKQLQLRARNKILLGVDKSWGVLHTGIELEGVGSRYAGRNEIGKMGGYALVNLTARYAINKAVSIEGRVNNLFDKNYEQARADWQNYTSLSTYNTPGLNAFIGVRYTPQ